MKEREKESNEGKTLRENESEKDKGGFGLRDDEKGNCVTRDDCWREEKRVKRVQPEKVTLTGLNGHCSGLIYFFICHCYFRLSQLKRLKKAFIYG